jgi:hypothetical protein
MQLAPVAFRGLQVVNAVLGICSSQVRAAVGLPFAQGTAVHTGFYISFLHAQVAAGSAAGARRWHATHSHAIPRCEECLGVLAEVPTTSQVGSTAAAGCVKMHVSWQRCCFVPLLHDNQQYGIGR